MKEINEVYERFKHLDALLSDSDWYRGNMIYGIAHDLWVAIKEEVKKAKGEQHEA